MNYAEFKRNRRDAQREDDARELFFERHKGTNGVVFVPIWGEVVSVPTSNGNLFFTVRKDGDEWLLSVKATGKPVRRRMPMKSRLDAISFCYTVAETVWKQESEDLDNYFGLVFDMLAIQQYAERKRISLTAIPLSAVRKAM